MEQVMSYLSNNNFIEHLSRESNHREFGLKSKYVLVIEEDYVNFLLIEESISLLGGHVSRAINLNEATKAMSSISRVDLIIINNSLTSGHQNEIVHYLKEKYSVPVVVLIDNNVEGNSRSQKVVDWVDCAVSINSVFDSISETFAELVNYA